MDHQLRGDSRAASRPAEPGWRTWKVVRQLALIAILGVPGFASAGIWSKLSISVAPGTILSLAGNYRSGTSWKDVFLPGAGLGLVLRYKLSGHFAVDAGYSYNWMFYRQGTRPSDYSAYKAAWIIPSYSLNGTFFILSGRGVRPYITLGGGVCPWWMSTRITGGTLLWFPGTDDVKFSKISWSVNSGAGVELALGARAAVFGEARYVHVFAKDASRFSTSAFTDQSLLGVRLGVTIYLGGESY
jgi:hypothetical protein